MDGIVKRFTFFRSFYESAETLPNDEEKLLYYEYITRYAFESIEPPREKRPAYSSFINAKENIASSIARIKRAEENGKKGGAPRGNQNARKYPKEETTNRLLLNQTDKEKEVEGDKDIEEDLNYGSKCRTIHQERDDRTGSPNINFDKIIA